MADPPQLPEKARIYQLMMRHFGNENETRKRGGILAENGCGKFSALNEKSLGELKKMNFTHLWLTGVLEQASGTAYLDRPADLPDILKGKAGSPYAIKDYFDICPDYALVPENRIEEFRACLARCKAAGLGVIIDFVPNHVARSYHSDVRPEMNFGEGDDTDAFFDRENNFFYLQKNHPGGGAPLKMPTHNLDGSTGFFEPEKEVGLVTGNNAVTWAPSINDWYETVKLNYGVDFTKGREVAHLPDENAALEEVPDTWRKMDAVLAHWQDLGVGGFRVDMAHMIPMAFWRWTLKRARERSAEVFFMAEAYDADPMKLTDGNVFDELLGAGFDAVYDDQSYDVMKGLYESEKWANDLDSVNQTDARLHHSLRYAENHDEVRLANPQYFGGFGKKVGRAVTAVLHGLGRGPVMIYSGQEVGEPAEGSEGFGGDDGRSSIFDYWSLPELCKWTNGGKFDGGRLSAEQKSLREWYGKLLGLVAEPAFAQGEFYGLNWANRENEGFGRFDGEDCSGHWCYAYLRSECRVGGQTFLVIANLNGYETMGNVRIILPKDAHDWAEMEAQKKWLERLGEDGEFAMQDGMLDIGSLGPCEARCLELL